jgi:hypothetical protein
VARLIAISAAIAVAAVFGAASAQDASPGWWSPGEGRTLPASVSYPGAAGAVGILNLDGEIDTAGPSFFEAIGTNGRACVTCHQPAQAMSVSAAAIAQRWDASGGADPIFAAADGSNCPTLPQGERASHSLVLERGVFRVALPWPPRRDDGSDIEPEFTLEVVRDPTGCNLSDVHGLTSPTPTISVYRRPRVAANLKYVDREGPAMNARNIAMANAANPETGRPSSMNLTSDARALSLQALVRSHARSQLQLDAPLTADQLEAITDFQRQVYMAQSHDRFGAFGEGEGAPAALGPRAMLTGQSGLDGDNFAQPVFGSFDAWRSEAPEGEAAAFRASAARGYDVFFTRPFFIRDAMHINTTGIGNPAKRTCATCHAMQMTGMALSAGWVDVGTTNAPFADESPDLPLFKVTCEPDAPPHLFLGRVIYTSDPGRALISGRCRDVGAIVMGQLRGLSARAPYFSNGSAASLRELVDFYDRRFNIRFSEQEKQDLVNFLSVL